MSLREEVEAQRLEDELRGTNERLARQLEQEKRRTDRLVAAVYQAVRDAAAGLRIGPVRPPKLRTGGKGDPEVAIPVLSDMQLAKYTPTYNTRVCEERVALYAEKIVKLATIQRADHPVRSCRVWWLGDMVEGEMIFPHQAHQIDASLYRQAFVDGPRILVSFLRQLLAAFDQVHVTAVPGNHGNIGGKAGRAHNPETNADRMLYTFVQGLLAGEKRLTWNVAYERNESGWYAVDYPHGPEHGHGILGFHGHQIPGSANYSQKTIANYVYGLASGAVPEPFDTVVHGHWHNARRTEVNRLVIYGNGSTESDNRYAQERLAAMGRPTQLLLFAHPRQGITSEHWVRLETA